MDRYPYNKIQGPRLALTYNRVFLTNLYQKTIFSPINSETKISEVEIGHTNSIEA